MISLLKFVLRLLFVIAACFGAYQFYEIKLSGGFSKFNLGFELELIINEVKTLVSETESILIEIEQVFKISP